MKIIIFGASGTGTTTLGKSVAEHLNWEHLDADDYYWEVTNPPYQKKVQLAIRNEILKVDYRKHEKIVVSGSLVSWGDFWKTAFDLGVFLTLPKEIRMARLRQRENDRYGRELATNSKLQAQSKAFLEWAAQYDDPNFNGRSITQHQTWGNSLNCEIIQIGDLPNRDRLDIIVERILSHTTK